MGCRALPLVHTEHTGLCVRLRWRVQWYGAWLTQPEAYVSVLTGALERLAGDVALRLHMEPCGDTLVELRLSSGHDALEACTDHDSDTPAHWHMVPVPVCGRRDRPSAG